MAICRIGYDRRVANDDEAPNRIREWREKRGLSQVDLARLLHVTPSALNKVEKGTRGLDQLWMRRIGAALNVSPAELLPAEDNPWALDSEERKLIDSYRHAEERDREKLQIVADVVLGYRHQGMAA
jgi:transcriptional regulator with XRE-family HTH domain